MCSVIGIAKAQEVTPLYPAGIPNATTSDSVYLEKNIPKLYRYLPPKEIDRHVGVLVIPGGGYAMIAMGHEGHDVAKVLISKGYTAFVLQYRLPSATIMKDKRIGPLQDSQRAVQFIRTVYPDLEQVGVIGFSAGGHLASTLITKFDKSYIDNPQHVSLRPDFAGLIYPVISMKDGITHQGSKVNLLGVNASVKDIERFSSDQQVSDRVCPVFFVHAKDDQAVPIENSYLMQAALYKQHIPNQLFTYEKGGHGFGLVNKTSSANWMDEFLSWVQKLGPSGK